MRNNLLKLNKAFQGKDHPKTPYSIALFESKKVTIEQFKNLLYDLENTKEYWSQQNLLGDKCLISVYNKGIVAKTNRIEILFKYSKIQANDLLVGARFYYLNSLHCHIFTYCLSRDQLNISIEKMKDLIGCFQRVFGSEVTKEQLTLFKKDDSLAINDKYFTKNQFIKFIEELSYVNRFDTYFCEENIDENAIVTLFDTNSDIISLLKNININISNDRVNQNNILLLPTEYLKLKAAAPYLISMAVSDFSIADLPQSPDKLVMDGRRIKVPTNEPIIGVIDTLFNKDVYFSEWVDYIELIDTEKIKPSPEDYGHGTAVSSLIVDLPNINPELDDGCGHFKVRHFGVALKKGGMTTFRLMKEIETIISTNQDIHVWNLSLGSTRPINENFISPEASILDELQVKYPDIIFVIAGTNTEEGRARGLIGSPADSINSVVVNSVRKSDFKPASYSRSGPALSFFVKPDVSCFGGDFDEPINVCYPYQVVESWGTSFAAPLIARKLAYIIDILKLPRACAKALLIDSAVGWKREFDMQDSNLIGRGIVPVDIHDVVESNSDEIRFFISGQSDKYLSYEYDLPVPMCSDKRFPYVARATLCYFPKCSRNQGVDYTDTELNLKFGQTRNDKAGNVHSINKDYQDRDGHFIKEKEARDQFRKWDNIKILTDSNIQSKRYKTNFGRDNWGIEVTYSRRYDESGGIKRPRTVTWGLVITLKALDGKNRIEEFTRACILNDWRVYPVSVKNMINLYNQSQVDVEFD